ncbi:Uma2 family endonuclease [Richelia sinica]|uniref:Uma2 family endonuclease n=1 Tax=Richelia sinica TaxID=1357545 RepID=UPI001681ED6D|nr:Uma2 family endonuclease [Richelia sinica]MBD2666581.1 Uma2 family endonuclease [Richelia sinica FACHB-800]
MSIPLVTRRFKVKEYHHMNQAGLLSEDDRVELINGEILEMSPIGTKHATCMRRLINLAVKLYLFHLFQISISKLSKF